MTMSHLARLGSAALLGLVLVATGCSGEAPAEPTTEPVASSTPTVAEADCPEPAADAPAGTAEDPYAPGEEVVVGCFTVVVNSVERDATDAVIAANPGAAPASGNVYMTATVTITRTAGGPADASDVEVTLSGSMSTSGEPSPDLAVTPPPPSGVMQEGDSTTGTYVYEMSGGASTSVELKVGSMTPITVLPY